MAGKKWVDFFILICGCWGWCMRKESMKPVQNGNPYVESKSRDKKQRNLQKKKKREFISMERKSETV